MYDYKYLDQNLRVLLGLVESRLSMEEIDDLKSYLDAGEYGVGFQYLCEILLVRNQNITPEAYKLFEELGTRMSLDPHIWAGLKNLVSQPRSA